jgi:hypothetical protein
MKGEIAKKRVKRWLGLLGMVLVLSGCGAAVRESGFYEHNTMYRSWGHSIFSLYGYKEADLKNVQESEAEDWWGITIEVPRR